MRIKIILFLASQLLIFSTSAFVVQRFANENPTPCSHALSGLSMSPKTNQHTCQPPLEPNCKNVAKQDLTPIAQFFRIIFISSAALVDSILLQVTVFEKTVMDFVVEDDVIEELNKLFISR